MNSSVNGRQAFVPSQYQLVLLWLGLLCVYGLLTQLPPIERVEPHALQGVDPVLHILIAERKGDGVGIRELERREGTIAMSAETADSFLRSEHRLQQQLGQFALNRTMGHLYLDLLPGDEIYINRYRWWSWTALILAGVTFILGSVWQIVVHRRVEGGRLSAQSQQRCWRISVIVLVVIVGVIHSMTVYYQGGLMVSPIGLVAGAILPLLLVHGVLRWENIARSWPLLVPVLVFVVGHSWAQVAVGGVVYTSTIEFMAHLFKEKRLDVFVYAFGLLLGLWSVIDTAKTPAAQTHPGTTA